MYIKTCASTANLGPGFDSLGLALSLYNELWIEESDRTEIINARYPAFCNRNHLVLETMKTFYKQIGRPMPEVRIMQKDQIPTACGLGSSASCIAAGFIAANVLSKSKLSKEELLQLACQVEGHPDNIVPVFCGGATVGVFYEGRTNYTTIPLPKNLLIAALIPDFTIKTKKARNLLPKKIPFADAVFNVSRAALLTASLCGGNWENLKIACQDSLHQPYRLALMPNMEKIFEISYENRAKAVFLSGAGPSIACLLQEEDKHFFHQAMQENIKKFANRWEIHFFKPDETGVAWTE